MTFTAEQYSQMAARFDEAAADSQVPNDLKQEFIRKAEWFRFLADRERNKGDWMRTAGASCAIPQTAASTPRTRPLIPALWATGGILYLLSTLALVSVFLPSQEERTAAQPTFPAKQAFRAGTTTLEQKQLSATAEKKHAISPHQPPYEVPGFAIPPLTTPNAPELQQSTNIPNAAPSSESASPAAEMLEVKNHATIRSGPSASAKKIGTASPGAALEVKARKGQWLQFVDPSSGNMGWIHSTLVGAGDDALDIEVHADAPPAAVGSKPEIAEAKKSQSKGKPRRDRSATDNVKAPADLPYDEEFIEPRGPRLGFRARRRMLREGLLSPNFAPP